jgi:hypothetical protein
MFRQWPLKVTILIAFFSFFYGMSKMIAPELYRDMSPPDLGYVFVPDDDSFVDTEQYIEIRFIKFGPEAPSRVTAWICRTKTGQPEALQFEPVMLGGVEQNLWVALLPTLHEKSARWFYYITIETNQGRTIEIRKDMNWFEELFSGFKTNKQNFWVTYEGNVVREVGFGKIMLASHITFSFGALLYLFHTLFYALMLLPQPLSATFIKAFKSMFWAFATFTFGAIVLGIPITWYTFGTGFQPWPTKGLFSPGDITDTKSTFLAVFWLILLWINFQNFRNARKAEIDAKSMRWFTIWTIIAILITVFVFLIPHSQFM